MLPPFLVSEGTEDPSPGGRLQSVVVRLRQPHARGPVGRPGEQPCTVRRPGHGGHLVLMHTDDGDFLKGGGGPDPYGAVVGACGDVPAVG